MPGCDRFDAQASLVVVVFAGVKHDANQTGTNINKHHIYKEFIVPMKTPYEMLCLLLDRVKHNAGQLNDPDLEEHERQSAHSILFECQQIPVLFEEFELDMRRQRNRRTREIQERDSRNATSED